MSEQTNTHTRTVAFRADTPDPDGGDGLTMSGYATTFDDPYPVSDWDGDYVEQIARGAFAKTIKERRAQIKVHYDHGHHPILGSIPIGTLSEIVEDDHGLRVSARLHDNWMTEPVRDAIASGSIDGMSMRFQVMKEDWDYEADPVERTIREIKLLEVGPVCWPANEATTLALRSLYGHLDEEARSGLAALAGVDAPNPAGIVDSEGTPQVEPDESTRSDGAAVTEHEPASLVTRQTRRQRGLILRGMTHVQAGHPAGAAGSARDAA